MKNLREEVKQKQNDYIHKEENKKQHPSPCVSERCILGTVLEGQVVYDSIGGVQPDDGSTRYNDDDEDWSVEGDNNSLSFPSYYIDENVDIMPYVLDLMLMEAVRLYDCAQGDATFHMYMSVSVADAGETTVVVSNINGNQQTKVPCENLILTVNTNKDLKIGNQEDEEMDQIMMPDSDVCAEMGIYNTSGDDNYELEEKLVGKVIKEPEIEAMELDSCLSQGKFSRNVYLESLL
nr:zinc finger, RING/FYVE/PHD-type, elonginA binding-protein 1 [Tanacetum cinerariifolium]